MVGTWRRPHLGKIGPRRKRSNKQNRDLELRYMFLGQIFAKNAKNDPKTLFEASKSVKKQKSENHGKVAK